MRTNKEIKKLLIEEEKRFVPDMKEEIMNNLGLEEPETNRKIFNRFVYGGLVFATALILLLGLFVFVPKEDYSTIFIDINPSLSLKINRKNYVKEVKALNEDAIIFLEDIDLIETSIDKAIDLIFLRALNQGYFTDEEAKIKVEATNKNEKTAENINNRIRKRLSEQTHNVIVVDEKEEAEQYGVSSGKMALVNKALKADPNLTVNEALKLDDEKLLKIINQKADKEKEKYDDKFIENSQEEKRVLRLIQQMTVQLNNISDRPGNKIDACYKFKTNYDEYLNLKELLSEEFLNSRELVEFNDLLDNSEELLDIIENLPERENQEKPGGPNKPSDKPQGPNKPEDKPSDKPENNPGNSDGPGKNKNEEPLKDKDNENKGNQNNKDKEENPNNQNKNK